MPRKILQVSKKIIYFEPNIAAGLDNFNLIFVFHEQFCLHFIRRNKKALFFCENLALIISLHIIILMHSRTIHTTAIQNIRTVVELYTFDGWLIE